MRGQMDGAGISNKARCAEDLRRRILTLDLQPGADLDEAALAHGYGISRPPLREVLNQLAGEGYVILRSHKGAQVAPMTHTTLRNFFLAAPMIYAATAQLAAGHRTAAQLAQLRDIQAQFRTALDDGDTAARALTNQRFHALIGEMAGNEYLAPSLRRLLIDHTRIGMSFFDPGKPDLATQRDTAAAQHDRLIDLIDAGDADGAAQVALDHWELSRAQIERFVTPRGMDIPLGEAPDQVRGGLPDQVQREAPDQVRGGHRDQVQQEAPDQVRGGLPGQVRGRSGAGG